MAIDYLSRYMRSFLCKEDTGVEVVPCLPKIFNKFGAPVVIKSDPGSHFGSVTKHHVESRVKI